MLLNIFHSFFSPLLDHFMKRIYSIHFLFVFFGEDKKIKYTRSNFINTLIKKKREKE